MTLFAAAREGELNLVVPPTALVRAAAARLRAARALDDELMPMVCREAASSVIVPSMVRV